MLIIMFIIGGALPWIGMALDSKLHPFNLRGPYSKFGALFIVPSVLIFVLGIALIIAGV